MWGAGLGTPVAAGGIEGTSSGEPTSSAASTPFSLPEGSGAFKHAWKDVSAKSSWELSCNTYLDEILAFGLGDKRLQLGCGESVDETSFRHDQEEDLGARKDREFVSLGRCKYWVRTLRDCTLPFS